jgi:hypothetical protein
MYIHDKRDNTEIIFYMLVDLGAIKYLVLYLQVDCPPGGVVP